VIFGTVVFGLLGIGLMLVGRWGSRSNARLGVIAGYDERSIQRRQAVLRRGAYTCYAAGAVFLVIAGILVFSHRLQCPQVPGQCTAACALAHQCAKPPPPR
jgi:hypothetical protein